jgi:hypothetical protein
MENFKPGDIVLVSLNLKIGKWIEYFMKLARKKRGLIVPKGRVASHAGMLVSMWGELCIAEAWADGISITPFKDVYDVKFNRIKVITPKKPYSTEEQDKVSRAAAQSMNDKVKYDFFGLMYQIRYVLSGGKKWDGPKGDRAEHRLYCTEAVAMWANKVRPKTFDMEYAANPLDIELNRYYKVIYDGSDIE